MQRFKRNEIVMLLGAGASVDAGIPHSTEMIGLVEDLVNGSVGEEEWEDYEQLYNCVKASILYGDGVQGHYDESINFNIERVVNTLDELARKERHPLYPFVGSWSPKLIEVAGRNFKEIKAFREKIVDRLRGLWLNVEYPEDADYYRALQQFQEQYEFQLRIFTLNYDLCVENNTDADVLERGFENKIWNWQRFELDEKNILLYKLHGSTDWTRNEDGKLTYKDKDYISHRDVEMIFGTSYKMQYVDPFLFFAYELRRWTLSKAKLIISIGYGFGDDHINGILGQALRRSEDKRLISVAPVSKEGVEGDEDQEASRRAREREEARIRSMLDIDSTDQVVCFDCGAKEFMEKYLNLEYISEEILGEEEESLFEEVDSEKNLESKVETEPELMTPSDGEEE